MVLRNSLLIGALIAGVAILVLMYVRRGLADLQGQIDDIETVLAAMPPALTSGQFNVANAFINPQVGGERMGGGGEGIAHQEQEHTFPSSEDISQDGINVYAMSEQEEELELDNDLLSQPNDNEYSVVEGNVGIASLLEPGVYQSGVVELTVLVDEDETVRESNTRNVIEDITDDGDLLDPPTDSSDNEDDATEDASNEATNYTAGDATIQDVTDTSDNIAIEAIIEASEPTPLANIGKVNVIGNETVTHSDALDILTLPELKARLKATQPHVKAIGRMKRAEVLDRLRSNPEVEGADDN